MIDLVTGVAAGVAATLLENFPHGIDRQPNAERAITLAIPALVYGGSSNYGFSRAHDCNVELNQHP
jgi:hypothetical protein